MNGRFQVAYAVLGDAVLDLECVHGLDHGLHGHENVLINESDVATFVVIIIARAVNDAHLFDKRRLARFARACNTYEILSANVWGCVPGMGFPLTGCNP